MRSRFRGALLGLACADSEPDGRWRATTSLALCLAESLVALRRDDPEDQLRRYLSWYRRGVWSSKGYCFGITPQTQHALERFESSGVIPSDSDFGEDYRQSRAPLYLFTRAASPLVDALNGIWSPIPYEDCTTLETATLAGAYWGVRGIPESLRERCYRAAEIIGLADRLSPSASP